MVDPTPRPQETVREPVTANKSSGHIARVNSASEGIAPLSHQALLGDNHYGGQRALTTHMGSSRYNCLPTPHSAEVAKLGPETDLAPAA